MVAWETVACYLRVNTVIFKTSWDIHIPYAILSHCVVSCAMHFGEKLFYGNMKSVKIVLRIIFSDLLFFFFAYEVGLLYLSCMYRQSIKRKSRSNTFLKTSKITFFFLYKVAAVLGSNMLQSAINHIHSLLQKSGNHSKLYCIVLFCFASCHVF